MTPETQQQPLKTNRPYLRSFNRFEVKYILDQDQAAELLRRISPYIRPDAYNGPLGFYPIVSLYYDSPDLLCFWEKVDGVKFRRKVRIRLYDEDPERAFLEIKQRIDQTTQKRRLLGSFPGFRRKLDLTRSPEFPAGSDSVLDEARFLVDSFRLEPRIAVSYNRSAWFGSYERGLRVTIDRNLRYGKYLGKFGFQSGRDRYFLPPSQMVLEVKFNDVVPGWLCSALNCLNLMTTRVSKYCHAVNHGEFRNELY